MVECKFCKNTSIKFKVRSRFYGRADYSLRCTNCGFRTPKYATAEEAVKAWNELNK